MPIKPPASPASPFSAPEIWGISGYVKNHLLTLARYHVWAFETLFDAIRPVDDARYHGDSGLYFRSIHGTLNHLLLGDRVWFGRFIARPYKVGGLDEELESDRERLEDALCEQATCWERWIAERDAAELDGVLDYRNLSGNRFRDPVVPTLMHVFNHATHHRGQVSAAVTRLGFEAPVMDLIYYLRAHDSGS